jgi:cell division transport system permease protein
MAKNEKNIIARRLAHSYLSSVLSISLVLYLVAIMIFLGINAKNLSDYFKENAVVSVILEPQADEAGAIKLESKLDSLHFVKETKYISREQGHQEMKALLGENFLDIFEVNPIPISIDLNLVSEYFSKDSIAAIEMQLMSIPLVREVTYQESLVEILNANLEKIGIVMAVVMLLLLIISFALINNTVRLNIYAKRFTIHTMRMVGAKRSFIRRPFMWQGFWQGVVAAIIADMLFAITIYYADRSFGELFGIFDKNLVLAVFGAVLLVGLFICVASAFVVVNKLAYISKDELYF